MVMCSKAHFEKISKSQAETHLEEREFHVPMDEWKGSEKFHPMDTSGKRLSEFEVVSSTDGNRCVRSDHYHLYTPFNKGWKAVEKGRIPYLNPLVKHSQGDAKRVSPRVTKTMREDIDTLAVGFDKMVKDVESRRQTFSAEMLSPFVPLEQQQIAMTGIDKQLQGIKVHREDCQRLLEMVSDAMSDE